MTYSLPEIADPLPLERQVVELHRLLATVLQCDESFAEVDRGSARILKAERKGRLKSVEGAQLAHACAIAHGIEFRGGQLKDGAPITRTDLEKSVRWLRCAIQDAIEHTTPEIRDQVLADPDQALSSTQPLTVIDGLPDPETKAKALLNRVYAVLWRLDRGGAPYPAETGRVTPTLRQRLEHHIAAVPGLNRTTVLDALSQLEDRIQQGTLGNAPANDVATLIDPFRQILLHYDAAAPNTAPTASQEAKPAPSRSVERIALVVAGVVILFLAIDRFTGRDTQASAGDLVVGKIDGAAKRDAARNEQSRSAARIEAGAFLADLKTVSDLADDLEQELRLWGEQILALKTNDDGRRFAADPDNVVVYRRYLRETASRQDASLLSSARGRLEDLKNTAERGATEGIAPTEEMRVLLERERERIRGAVDAHRQRREHIDQLLALSPSAPPTGASTLERALADLSQRDADEDRGHLADLEQQLKDDRQRRLAEARKRSFDAETDRLVGEERDKAKLEEARRLESKYPMFFRKGTYAFEGYHNSSGGDDQFEFPRLPTLQALEALGITREYRTFRAAVLGERVDYGKQFNQNDRAGFWPKPESEEDETKIRQAFEEFRELAPYFVSAGLLRK